MQVPNLKFGICILNNTEVPQSLKQRHETLQFQFFSKYKRRKESICLFKVYYTATHFFLTHSLADLCYFIKTFFNMSYIFVV